MKKFKMSKHYLGGIDFAYLLQLTNILVELMKYQLNSWMIYAVLDYCVGEQTCSINYLISCTTTSVEWYALNSITNTTWNSIISAINSTKHQSTF